MTNLRPLHPIGYIHSPQGLKGEVFLVLKALDDAWLDIWTELIVSERYDEATDQPPFDSLTFHTFPIDRLRIHRKQGKQGVVLGMDGWEDVSAAEKFVARAQFGCLKSSSTPKWVSPLLKEIEGFTVVDSLRGEIGPIVGFSSNGPQDLLEVRYQGRMHYIPWSMPSSTE